ncbi:VOC family protein [Lentzea sp. CC55]|uniref:VOC family protein n=1 Tax=Lentzea sp. CC55 TaxID=2884909 RepID=UPI001F448830|nr:VOC family protein [Lentzea sp. CC55]MCG8928248.1 VOC family protein [Lentzea sp. CC55]
METRLSYAKIVVSDLERSIAFYTKATGLSVLQRVEFTAPDVTEVVLADASGQGRVVLMCGDSMPVQSGAPAWTPFVLTVDDAAAAAAEIADAGYALACDPPLKVGGITITLVPDPDGYLIELISFSPDPSGQAPVPEGKVPHPLPQFHDRVLN